AEGRSFAPRLRQILRDHPRRRLRKAPLRPGRPSRRRQRRSESRPRRLRRTGDRGGQPGAAGRSGRQAYRDGRRLRRSSRAQPLGAPRRRRNRFETRRPPERRFSGVDAYRRLIESRVDVVLLATPPHFPPLHLKAAIGAGKHVFAEKPVAVDAPGVRSILTTCELARQKGLSVVSGLCLRYSDGFRETVGRVHDGEIGEIKVLLANDYRGPIWT